MALSHSNSLENLNWVTEEAFVQNFIPEPFYKVFFKTVSPLGSQWQI